MKVTMRFRKMRCQYVWERKTCGFRGNPDALVEIFFEGILALFMSGLRSCEIGRFGSNLELEFSLPSR
jgi:hypothetical protein